jgi:hypothetical protein
MVATRYQPTHLKRWQTPECYIGQAWDSYYVFLSQHRDSDCLTRSNYRVAFNRLHAASVEFEEDLYKKGSEEAGVLSVRESHWAVGWVEWLAIHQDNEEALRMADTMAAAIADYPALCEDDWCALEDEEACEAWKHLSVRDRLETMKGARGVSMFAARHDDYPSDDCGLIQHRLLGH